MDPLAQLFERYHRNGDLQALAQVFDALAPRLLPVALHLTGNPADAEDVLQQTFLLAMDRAEVFDASRRLEPWLAGLLTNVARNARRHAARRVAEPLPEHANKEPMTAEIGPMAAAERAELIAVLRTSVDALAPEQRQVLRLQLQHGMSPVEIAEVIEVPPGTVRMRLHRGLLALRRLLPAGFATCLFGSLSARGLASVRESVLHAAGKKVAAASGATVTAVVVTGCVLTMKKLLVGIVVVCVLGLWWAWPEPVLLKPPMALPPSPASPVAAAVSSGTNRTSAGEADGAVARVAQLSAIGALRVRIVASVDGAGAGEELPLPGTWLDLWSGESPLVPFDRDAQRSVTDAAGEVVLTGVEPGPWQVQILADRDSPVHAVNVVAGAETLVTIQRRTLRIARGIVVDADGRPVGGAEVWVHRGTAMGSYSLPEPAVLTARRGTRTGPDGRFGVPLLAREHRIGACAPGHGEAFGRLASGDGELRLVLGRAFATVSGTVRDGAGAAVGGAVVHLTPAGQDFRRAADGTVVAARVDRLAHADADGRFHFDGVAPGKVRVWATAWPRIQAIAELDAPAFGIVECALVMQAGTMVVGTVRNADGTPARVHVFSTPTLPAEGHYCHCDCREDGSYQLFYQPQQRFFVCIGRVGAVLATREIAAPSPGVIRCDFVLDQRTTVPGRIVGPDGRGLAAWQVVATNAAGHRGATRADGAGSFRLTIPAEGAFVVRAHAPDGGTGQPAVEVALAAGTRRVELEVSAAAMPSARVTGRLVDASGRVLDGRQVLLHCGDRSLNLRETSTGGDGRFEFAGLPATSIKLAVRELCLTTPIEERAVAAASHVELGDLVATPHAALRVDVVHTDGSTWRGDLVGVELLDSEGHRVAITSTWRAAGLDVQVAPGRYRVAAVGEDLLAEPQAVDVAANTTRQTVRVAVAIGRSRRLVWNGDGREKPQNGTVLHVTIRAANGDTIVRRDLADLMPDLRGYRYWYLQHVFAFGHYEVEARTDAGHVYRTTFTVTDDLEAPTRIDVPFVGS